MRRFLKRKINTSSIYTALFLKYAVALLFLLITQWLFLILNKGYFNISSTAALFSILAGGIRYAAAVTVIFLSPFILLNILPFHFRNNKIYQTIADLFFYIGNALLTAINIIDIVYYRFTFRRTAGDIFQYASVGGDFKVLIPQFVKDFWSYVLIFLILFILLIWITRKITWKEKQSKHKYQPVILFFVTGIFFLLLTRDSFSLNPLSPNNVVKYAVPANTALVVNTPYTITSTLQTRGLQEKYYFAEGKKAEKIFSPVNIPSPRSGRFEEHPSMNVVVIILESFSAEYIACLNAGRESFTPFLDSLAEKSIVFDGMANGKRSIESIPSVVAGLPSLMNDAYIMSLYGKNKINTIPSILKKYGYYSAFFHGGYNGSMGFDTFSQLAGYDDYFGMNEYGDKKDYDRQWGIFDEPFLQYMAKKIDGFPKPFHAAVFTISSHHPYTIPAEHKGKFKSGEIPILQPVMYTDYALKRFFETISNYSWYENTLFVITADHTAQPIVPESGNAYRMYQTPMFFFSRSDTVQQRVHKIVQQADILPSVIDYLNLNEPCIAFGKSAFSSDTIRFHVAYTNGFYQLLRENYLIFFKEKVIAAYQIKKDPNLKNNLINTNDPKIQEQEIFLKSIIQQYNDRLIHNRLAIETHLSNES